MLRMNQRHFGGKRNSRRPSTTWFCDNVLSSDRMKLSNVRSLIVLRLREGLTYVNNNIRGTFSGET